MSFRGAIFDLDGTVVENAYDWPRIKEEMGVEGMSILDYLDGLEEPERSRKWAVLERHEAEQTEGSALREGVQELLAFLGARGVAAALVTNNTLKNTDYLLRKFGLGFDCVITRESGLWKPSGAPLREAMERMGLRPDECFAVGDTRFDVLAAVDAGIGAIFILADDPQPFFGFPVEVVPDVEALEDRLGFLLTAEGE
jgi:HAD superfamily hydrolase (TIGR01509 family)